MKNLFELKNARNVVVDGNVLENNWTHAQTGYAVLFTVRNQDGTAPWSTVDTITFTNNIVRHAPGGINILGRDDLNPSDLVKNVVIRNNLFDDLTSAWGNNLPWLLLGNGADRLTIDHNTIVHAGPSLVLVYAIPTTNFVYTNNMARHNQYGFLGDGRAPGMDSINVYLPGAVLSRNIIVAANPAIYPSANSPCGTATCYPSETQWEASFMNFSGGNYRLLATSPYVTGGSGSTALGANIDAIVLASSGS